MARKKGPQVDQAFEYIKERILNYEIAPGSVISDHLLAQELGMSRAPVREAMQKLETKGLIQREGSRAVCAGITMHDVDEICQIRSAIESLAVQVIVGKGGLTEEQKNRLTEVYQKLYETSLDENNTALNYEYDDKFHALLVEFTGNKRLCNMHECMRLQISRARWLNIVLPKRKNEALEEHKAIYEAIMENCGEKAEKAMKFHQQKTAENFKKVLENKEYQKIFHGISILRKG